MNLKLSTMDLDALLDLTKTAVVKHETATLRAWELPDGSAVVMTQSGRLLSSISSSFIRSSRFQSVCPRLYTRSRPLA